MNVYYSDLQVVVRQDVPSYTIIMLLSDIGGTLGLWAGISIISVFELLELIIKVCYAGTKADKKETPVKELKY